MKSKYETVTYICNYCKKTCELVKHDNQKKSFMGYCFNPGCDNSKMHKQILLIN